MARGTRCSGAWRLALLVIAAVLLTVLVASHPEAELKPISAEEHRCGFDGIYDDAIKSGVSGISHIVQPSQALEGGSDDTVSRITSIESAVSTTWQPVRIRVFTSDLDDTSKYCTKSGQTRPDFQGGTTTCTSSDVLTDAKKRVLTEFLIPSAIQLHEDRLNVQRISGNIVVGASMSTSKYCKEFIVPSSHKSTGVSGADFILYMSAGPTSGSTIAWALTCQYFSNGRPSVGVSNVSPKYISADPQTVRTIAHEILHALGFNQNLFTSQSMVASVALRGKGYVPVITSSNVVAKAQAQYGCSTQQYMELEDQGGSGTAGSHWKRRSAKDELMAGISGAGYYTALTIAAMQDTGFYTGNYDNAEPMSYGQNVGCSLVTSKCVIDGVSQFSSMFCTSGSTDMVCTSDHRAIGKCNKATFSSTLPSYFQYFGYSNVGGTDSLMDYCPYIQEYSNTNCLSNTGILKGSVFGVMSRCFSAPSGVRVGGVTYGQYGLCADVQCGASTYGVKVYGASGYTTCTPGAAYSLSSLSSKFSSGTLYCPSYDAVCGEDLNASSYDEYRELLGDAAAGALRTSAVALILAAVLAVLNL